MKTKAALHDLIAQYASKVGIYAAIEATRIATDRRDRGPLPSEVRLKEDVAALRSEIKCAIDALPIE